MNNNQKAFIAMGLMVALAFVVVGASSFVAPVSAAKPGNVPPSPGTGQQTGDCASAAQGSSAKNCHFVPDR